MKILTILLFVQLFLLGVATGTLLAFFLFNK